MTTNFQPYSDIDKLYINRTKGGRGLQKIKTMYENRLIAIRQHLLIKNSKNNMKYVIECQQSFIIRVGNELLTNKNIAKNPDEKPKSVNKKYTAEKTKEHEKDYINKKMHGYFQKKLQQDENIDSDSDSDSSSSSSSTSGSSSSSSRSSSSSSSSSSSITFISFK